MSSVRSWTTAEAYLRGAGPERRTAAPATLDRTYPEQPLHLVTDNDASHKTPEVRA